jgi:hypothetical protein
MSPGTIKGDITEYKAIENFLQACLYWLLISGKLDTFCSWILSMELAILMMQHNTFIGVPFAAQKNKRN